jgi:hypothetical protein
MRLRNDSLAEWRASERGLGLFEVMAGTVVATLAVLGLAYSFGIGRGLIDRYEVARRALGRAEYVMDSLGTVPPDQRVSGSQPFWIDGMADQAGVTSWTMETIDDPIDGTGGADPEPADMKRAIVVVQWKLGDALDQLVLTRLMLAQ